MKKAGVTQTNDLTYLLRHLRVNTYRDIPDELFDRYLWLYSEIEDLQHRFIYGKRSQKFAAYIHEVDGSTTSIALTRLTRKGIRIQFAGCDVEALTSIVCSAQAFHKRKRFIIEIDNHEIAADAALALNANVFPGAEKLYTTNPPTTESDEVTEMGLQHESLLADLPERRWPCYRYFLRHGYRFFGRIHDGRLISMCGLIQLTSHTSQVIGVETFRNEDRRRGYARTVCAAAVREGLKSTPCVTWSTSSVNVPSLRTAKALGFIPYSSTATIQRQRAPGR